MRRAGTLAAAKSTPSTAEAHRAAGGAGRRTPGDVAAERLLFDEAIRQREFSIISVN